MSLILVVGLTTGEYDVQPHVEIPVIDVSIQIIRDRADRKINGPVVAGEMFLTRGDQFTTIRRSVVGERSRSGNRVRRIRW